MLAQLKHPALMKVTLYKMGNLCGICAPVLWASIIIFCGSVRPEYSHFTQFISELGERGSSTEFIMRYAGFLPTGLMHVAFSAFLYVTFKGSRLTAIAATLLAINGLARIGAGIFPCEVGCTGPSFFDQSEVAYFIIRRRLFCAYWVRSPVGYLIQTISKSPRP